MDVGGCRTPASSGMISRSVQCLCDPAGPKMQYVLPFSIMKTWLASCGVSSTRRLRPTLDDVVDVLKGLLSGVPVDEVWYQANYPVVSGYITRLSGETAVSHFLKHGYFEGRFPFAPDWNGLRQPIPFSEIKAALQVVPALGSLRVEIEQERFLEFVRRLLESVPVDDAWYRATYSGATKMIAAGEFRSSLDHYTQRGYFEGLLPFNVDMEPEWYLSQYSEVREVVERGAFKSPQYHFVRAGYNAGYSPRPL
jgi:hypothetical protein